MVDLKKIKPQYLWYVIGLITADGSLSKDGRHIDITSKDRDFLVDIRDALGVENKIGRKSRGVNLTKDYSNLQLGDVNFYKYLLSIGLKRNKSLILKSINVKNEYFNDFLRGVIDGDGNISTWIHRTNLHRQWSLRITSAAPVFIKWLKKEIENRFKVRGKLYGYIYKDKKNYIYNLKFGKLAAKIIVGEIYYKKALCLNRKNEKKLSLLKDESKMKNYANVICSDVGTGRQSGLKIQ